MGPSDLTLTPPGPGIIAVTLSHRDMPFSFLCRRVGILRLTGWCLVVEGCVCLLTGCVDRRFVVTSDPPRALVLRNYQPIGAAPADDHFVYYGKYHFTLIKHGYHTLQIGQ